MAVDGIAETANIITQLGTLCGGRVFDDIQDDNESLLAADGSVRPFIVVLSGDPYPTARDRGVGKEPTQPHVMAVSIICYGPNAQAAAAVAGAATNLLLGWSPGATADQMKAAGGYRVTEKATQFRPSRSVRTRQMTTVLNL
jgi:hypothetical protein